MEKKLIATIGVLLPPTEFVIDSERDTFFKTIAGVGSKPDNVSFNLEAQ
jgi:hypothetical protein